jgi:hypothetical protein
MNTLYKYRKYEGIAKYEIISGKFGIDTILHLKDTTCKHTGPNCEIEVEMCQDGKSYTFLQALNWTAQKYEHYHSNEVFYDNEKDAFVDGLKTRINTLQNLIDEGIKSIEEEKEKLENLTEKEIYYLTANNAETLKKGYIENEGTCNIVGNINFFDGKTGYLTDCNYMTHHYEDDEGGDRIILVENTHGKLVTESGCAVYLTETDFNNHKNNNNIENIKNIIDIKKKTIDNSVRIIESIKDIINKKDNLTVDEMINMTP